jgi:methyl-accepting chemotaxis protein
MNFVTRISNDPTLPARLLTLLPNGSTKTDLINAAMGFRNQGQFIAALHAAKDLNISFAQLKAEMTGPGHDSLGQAIHDLLPKLDAQTLKADVTLARQEAKTDLQAARAAKEAAEDANEAAKEAAKDAKEAAKEKAEEAKEATKEAAEDAKEAAEEAKEAAEEANEAAKNPTSGATTGSTTVGSQTRP